MQERRRGNVMALNKCAHVHCAAEWVRERETTKEMGHTQSTNIYLDN